MLKTAYVTLLLTLIIGFANAQSYLIFDTTQLQNLRNAGCIGGTNFILNHKTTYVCQDGQLKKIEGYVPMSMIVEASFNYIHQQVLDRVKTGSAKWDVCSIFWRVRRRTNIREITCPDSIKWFSVCDNYQVLCGNILIDTTPILGIISRQLYGSFYVMEDMSRPIGVYLVKESEKPMRVSGILFEVTNGLIEPRFDLKFSFPKGKEPDLRFPPLLVNLDSNSNFLFVAFPMGSQLGVFKCQFDTCWIFREIELSEELALAGSIKNDIILFNENKLMSVNIIDGSVQVIDFFPEYLANYLSLNPQAFRFCPSCEEYKLWILNPFSSELVRYSFSDSSGKLSWNSVQIVLDSSVYQSFLNKKRFLDSLFDEQLALCDIENAIRPKTAGIYRIQDVFSDSTFWIRADRELIPCEKFAFPETFYFQEIWEIKDNKAVRKAYFQTHIYCRTRSQSEILEFLQFGIHVNPLNFVSYLKNDTLKVIIPYGLRGDNNNLFKLEIPFKHRVEDK